MCTGSGKTTLLNVIARRVQGTTAGRVLLNARPISERAFQHVCAYVSFKQQLYSRLTVEQTLVYQARLTLASALSYKEKAERVRTHIPIHWVIVFAGHANHARF
jgi:ABC-type multidrug transport system ATPase subunit